MGLLNWMVHRSIRRHAEKLTQWVLETHQQLHAKYPELSERDIIAKLLEQRGRFPGGEKARDAAIDRYGSSLNGICYFLGLNSQAIKGFTVFRGVQYTEYMDIALKERGLNKPSDEIRRGYFKSLGLPEEAVTEDYLRTGL